MSGVVSRETGTRMCPGPVKFCLLASGTPYTDSGNKSIWNRPQVAWKAQGHQRFTFYDTRAKAISKLRATVTRRARSAAIDTNPPPRISMIAAGSGKGMRSSRQTV